MEKTIGAAGKRNGHRIKISQTAVGIIIISLIGGIFNGLIGAGGGIILSLGFSALIANRMNEKKDIYFNSQAAMIPVSVISYLLYAQSGSTTSIPLFQMLIPAAVGGILGGVASSYISSKYIRIIFAVIVVFSGARMIFSALAQ